MTEQITVRVTLWNWSNNWYQDCWNILKDRGITFKFVGLDDFGENASFGKAFKESSFCVKFKFSGPRTPQRNSKVER
jgi:hypothetical protein